MGKICFLARASMLSDTVSEDFPAELIKFLDLILNVLPSLHLTSKIPSFFVAPINSVFKEITPPWCWISPSKDVISSGTSIMPVCGEKIALSVFNLG